MSKLTHNFLVKRAIKWLYSYGCGFAVGEVRSLTVSGEIPDAIGFKSNQSILVECKVSRADFLKDKNKYFRQNSKTGMGNLRIYLCPKDVIKIEDLPKKWGLMYCDEKGKITKVKMPIGNVDFQEFWQEKNCYDEAILMYSCLRRFKQGKVNFLY